MNIHTEICYSRKLLETDISKSLLMLFGTGAYRCTYIQAIPNFHKLNETDVFPYFAFLFSLFLNYI